MLYLYLQVKSIPEIQFTTPLRSFLKEKQVLVFEADNHSDPYLINQSVGFIQDHDPIIIHLEVVKEESLGSLNKLFEALRKSNAQIHSFISGEHPSITLMFKHLGIEAIAYETVEELESKLESILN